MFLERLKEDISTPQKAFPCRLAKITWKWQNSLCATLSWELPVNQDNYCFWYIFVISCLHPGVLTEINANNSIIVFCDNILKIEVLGNYT